jgi:DNA invertase Pin-like site-specific DNA recombinase
LAEIEEQESGNNNERPALAEALRLCRMYHATLIIAKLDRLSRNVAFLDAVSRSRVKFVAVDVPDMDEMKLSILSFVAQIERQMISARTKAALAAARARGVQLGRPPGKHPQPVHLAKKASAASVASRQATARERCIDFRREVATIREDGITTWAGIAAALNDAGFRAPRGGQWSATQVLRTMKYCEEVK